MKRTGRIAGKIMVISILGVVLFCGCANIQEEENTQASAKQEEVVTPVAISAEEAYKQDQENMKNIPVPKTEELLYLAVRLQGEQLTEVIVNDSKEEIGSGSGFELQRLENNRWVPVEFMEDASFTAEGWVIPPRDTFPNEEKLTDYFEYLETGTYRELKEVYAEGKTIVLEAEFVLLEPLG